MQWGSNSFKTSWGKILLPMNLNLDLFYLVAEKQTAWELATRESEALSHI